MKFEKYGYKWISYFVGKIAIRIPKSLHEYTQTQVDERKYGNQ